MIIALLIITTFFIVIGFITSALLKAKFYKSAYKRFLKGAILILVVLYGFTAYLIYKNTKPNELVITDNYIEFTESYGLKIPFDSIRNIQQTTIFPLIESREEGFSLMHIRKGRFEEKSGKISYLLLNETVTPILKITQKNGEKIYFNSLKNDSKQQYTQLQNIFSYQK